MLLTRKTSSRLTLLLSIFFIICLAATVPTGGQSTCTPLDPNLPAWPRNSTVYINLGNLIAKPLITYRQVEPLIIVMVENGGTEDDRYDEYTPTKPPNFKSGGKADSYGRMLVEELKPLTRDRERVEKGNSFVEEVMAQSFLECNRVCVDASGLDLGDL